MYKKVADKSSPTLDNSETDLVSAFEYYGIEGEPSEYLIDEYLSNIINESLTSGKLEVNKIKRAKDHLLLDYFFNGTPLKSYLNTLEVIDKVARLNNLITSFEDEEKWKNAISTSLDYNLIIKRVKNHRELKQEYLRHYNVSKSARYFQNEGFDILLKDGKFLVPINGLMKVCEDIEIRMKLIGGEKFTEMLFSSFYQNRLYNEKLERFFLNRKLGYNRENPLSPFGYLLNLGAKYTFFNVTIDNPRLINYIFHSIIEKAEYLVAIYNIQPYNSDQDWNVDNITDSIREIALFGSVFSINQLKPSHVSRILKGLFSWVDPEEMELTFGGELNQIVHLINKILSLSNNIKPLTFKIEDLGIKNADNNSLKMLDAISIPGRLVNKNFHLPDDKPSFIFKPPIIKNGDEYVLLNSSWRSPNFYESMMSKLREKHKNLDDKIGLIFEDYVKQELSKKGITCLSGKYKAGKKEPQCDIVIEDENNIVFIEIKKKALTSASRAGDDIKLIIDLSKSILDAHLQTGNHELFLKKNEYIEFENKKKLYLKGRFVIRVALTLLDFGSFQDRVILSELFKILSNSNLQVKNAEYKSQIKKISGKMSKFREQCINLTGDDGFYMQMAFFNCFFLSLPQLIMLIDDSTDNESFIQNLKGTMGITNGSYDYYYEYTFLNSIFTIKSP